MVEAVEIVSLPSPSPCDAEHPECRAHGADAARQLRGECQPARATRRGGADRGGARWRIAGAALDVFESRSGVKPELLQLARENRVLLAHMASATLGAA